MSFGGLTLTNKGSALQTKALMGTKLTFTRIGFGDGLLASGQTVASLLDLENEVFSADITKMENISAGKVSLSGLLSNQTFSTGFYWREIGVFAEDPDEGEILYCYSNAGTSADYIPPISSSIIEKIVEVYVLVGNATNVTAEINKSLVYETPAGAQQKIDVSIDAAVAPLNEQLATTDEQIVVLNKLQVSPDSFPRETGETDDTLRFKRMIAYAKNNGFKRVKVTDGAYTISDSLYVTKEGDKLGISIECVSPETVIFIADLLGDKPLFIFERVANNVQGYAERWSNGGLKNARIISKTLKQGTGIYLRGSVFARFSNIRITNMNYGIWLHNEGAGIYTEANIFRDVRLDFNKENIRLEQGTGNESFHGNVFDKIYMNVLPGSIGLHLHSGYYYGGRFDLIMWGQTNDDGTQPTGDNRPIYVKADGTARHNKGFITVESYGESVLTGSGMFWFNGQIRGIGGTNNPKNFVDVSTIKTNGERVFACDNYYTTKELGSTGMLIKPIEQPNQKREGIMGTIHSLVNSGEGDAWLDSLIALSRDGSPSNNGFYTAAIPKSKTEADATLGLFLSALGQFLRTYNSNGLTIQHNVNGQNITSGTFANGFFNGKVGKEKTTSLAANAGVTQMITNPGYVNTDEIFLVSVRISGAGFDYRKLFSCNYGSSSANGSFKEIADHSTLSKTGVTVTSIWVGITGEFCMNIQTDIPLTVKYKAMAIGDL